MAAYSIVILNVEGGVKSAMLESLKQYCPYCGEMITLVVDGSAGDQQYVEDCFVCCRPMVVCVNVDFDGDVSLSVYSEDE